MSWLRPALGLVALWVSACDPSAAVAGTYSGDLHQNLRQTEPVESAGAEERTVRQTWVVELPNAGRLHVTRQGEPSCALDGHVRDTGVFELSNAQACDFRKHTLQLAFGDLVPRESRVVVHLVWTWIDVNGDLGSLTESGGLWLQR